ncbi:MAG: hypothetical protein ACXW4B_11050 [Micavibrio sp.]
MKLLTRIFATAALGAALSGCVTFNVHCPGGEPEERQDQDEPILCKTLKPR